MGEIRLFHVIYGGVHELGERSFPQEHELHKLFEVHLHDLTGITFLASEYITSSGRIDTLGIDDRDCPVVIEYKRGLDENVINQGVRYLNWLKRRDNHENFRRLVREKIAPERVKGINFKGAWLLCVAGAFPAQDIDAAGNSKARVELVRYRRFGCDLNMLMLEWVFGKGPVERVTVDVRPAPTKPEPAPGPTPFPPDIGTYRTWDRVSEEVRTLFLELLTFTKTLGNTRVDAFKTSISFRRMKEAEAKLKWPPVFAHVRPNITSGIRVDVLERTQSAPLEDGFTSLAKYASLYRTFVIHDRADLEKAKPLIREAYERH